MSCSHCRGAGKVAVKGTVEKRNCSRCEGTGTSPDPDAEKELVAFLKTKRGPMIAIGSTAVGVETGSFELYK